MRLLPTDAAARLGEALRGFRRAAPPSVHGPEATGRDRIATVLDVPIETVEITLIQVGTGGVDAVVESWHAEVGAA